MKCKKRVQNFHMAFILATPAADVVEAMLRNVEKPSLLCLYYYVDATITLQSTYILITPARAASSASIIDFIYSRISERFSLINQLIEDIPAINKMMQNWSEEHNKNSKCLASH
ncbi:hypothetical protein Bhyg_09981 [Pseudolycoriella hygida]|uniref:Uncharacterized protein n=1 Tax=Pseudolycoriella hygida TaxID=35572 RepID=A0A9Q0MSP3_9DIPT|nr:hypothetical protein Bhyg_09981 [Pseudolycoriella hygida]